jgi:hypothetical protein
LVSDSLEIISIGELDSAAVALEKRKLGMAIVSKFSSAGVVVTANMGKWVNDVHITIAKV